MSLTMAEPKKRKPKPATGKPKPSGKPPKPTAQPADGRTAAFTAAEIRRIRGKRTLKQAGDMVGVTWRAWFAWEHDERAPSRSLEILLALMRDGKLAEPAD